MTKHQIFVNKHLPIQTQPKKVLSKDIRFAQIC